MVRISFLTCFFLIALRLVIGWHFFFEGVAKYESTQHAGASNSKPFSSKGYFAEAAGPAGPFMRGFIGDDDAAAIDKLTPVSAPDDKSEPKMPAGLEKEWDNYLAAFSNYYHLNDAEKKEAAGKLDRAKVAYVQWLTDKTKLKDGEEPRKIKKKVVAVNGVVEYEAPDKIQPRLKEYKQVLANIDDIYAHRLPEMGNTENVHPTLRSLKTDAATMRADLMKDVDDQTKKMKESLAKVVAGKLAGFSIGPPDDKLVDDRVLKLLELKKGNGQKVDASQMPAALEKNWDDYYAFQKEVGHDELRNDPKRGDAILAEAKLGNVRYLNDLDPFTGYPLPDKDVAKRLAAYRAALDKLREAETKMDKDSIGEAKAETARLRKTFIDDITNQTEYMKRNLGGFTDEGYKGIAPTETPKSTLLGRELPTTHLDWLDWSTRWGILVAGGCLLLGLFTRLACLGCIVFLATEFLSNSPWPWLPASPKSEGNYVYINKNVVELVALLVLVTLPTGRWVGLDAILSRLWPFGRRKR